jgi:hypothetical protein
MHVTTETVTPYMAETWLKKNIRNRSTNQTRVETIAADILAGRWVVNGDAIRFGADDELYDGQHRLMAICKAGVPVQSNVVRGLEPEARDMIDMGGAVRNARDVVAITDGINVSKAHVAWVVAADKMLDLGTLNSSTNAVTAAGLRRAIERHAPAAKALGDALGSGNHRRLVSAASIAAMLIAWKSAPEKTVAFAEAVKTGEGLVAGDPALTFRNFLIDAQGKRVGSSARDDIALRTFTALDAHVRGESIKLLRANEGARERFIAAWKGKSAPPAAKATKTEKAASKPAVTPSAPGRFADAIRVSQIRDTKKRTPDAPPPPVEVMPLKHSNTKTVAQIAAVREYLRDGKAHRTYEIADACGIPRGTIGRILIEALDVYNVEYGLWAMKKTVAAR